MGGDIYFYGVYLVLLPFIVVKSRDPVTFKILNLIENLIKVWKNNC